MSTYPASASAPPSFGSLLRLDGPIPQEGTDLPSADYLSELSGVQGNILQPHGRRFALHVLLRFTSPAPAQAWLASLASQFSTAADELVFRRRRPRPVFLSLALSASGLVRAGYKLASGRSETQRVFSGGMKARQTALADPPATMWEPRYRDGVDALLIVAADDSDEAWRRFRELFAAEPIEGLAVVGVEVGQRLTNEFGEDIEHFRHVDGTSQPLFFAADVERDRRRNRFDDWSPAFPPHQVLVACPSGGYGSYLVFRKLEQDLAAFAAAKEQWRARNGRLGDNALAGASLVGRFEDGRPVGLYDELPSVLPVENGFTFDRNPPACPIGSHVRVVNPRTARDRSRVIARRGVPYGAPPSDAAWATPATLPSSGLGLLFMAYMADIGAQFEAIQIAANGSDRTHRDPLIGQGRETNGYGTGAPARLRGGEYLFVPSPSFLGLPASGSFNSTPAARRW